MRAKGDVSVPEPHAGASPAARRRFLTLAWLFLAGPVIWIVHFMVVYLLTEALCDSPGSRIAGFPAASAVTVVATALAVLAVTVFSARAHQRWRASTAGQQEEPDAALALVGVLLGVLFLAAILFVGLPALALDPCLP